MYYEDDTHELVGKYYSYHNQYMIYKMFSYTHVYYIYTTRKNFFYSRSLTSQTINDFYKV